MLYKNIKNGSELTLYDKKEIANHEDIETVIQECYQKSNNDFDYWIDRFIGVQPLLTELHWMAIFEQQISNDELKGKEFFREFFKHHKFMEVNISSKNGAIKYFHGNFLPYLEKYNDVNELEISVCSDDENLEPLKNFKSLKILDFYLRSNCDQAKLIDISALSHLKQLVALRIIHQPIKNFDVISELQNLKALNIGSINNFKSSNLRNLKKLQILIVNPDFKTIEEFDEFAMDIDDIKHLNLIHLDLSYNCLIKNIYLLGEISSLVRLRLTDCGLSDILFLKNLTNLKQLIISDNNISENSIAELKSILVNCDIS